MDAAPRQLWGWIGASKTSYSFHSAGAETTHRENDAHPGVIDFRCFLPGLQACESSPDSSLSSAQYYSPDAGGMGRAISVAIFHSPPTFIHSTIIRNGFGV